MTCLCGKAFTKHTAGEMATLVGYGPDERGHLHDDNCRYRIYVCEDGHQTKVYWRNRCPDCDWHGKTACGCHDGLKVESWPDAEPMSREETLQTFLHSR